MCEVNGLSKSALREGSKPSQHVSTQTDWMPKQSEKRQGKTQTGGAEFRELKFKEFETDWSAGLGQETAAGIGSDNRKYEQLERVELLSSQRRITQKVTASDPTLAQNDHK